MLCGRQLWLCESQQGVDPLGGKKKQKAGQLVTRAAAKVWKMWQDTKEIKFSSPLPAPPTHRPVCESS